MIAISGSFAKISAALFLFTKPAWQFQVIIRMTSLDIAPVISEAHVGDYGDGEFGYVFHLVLDELLEFFGFGGDDVEEELVVDLEGHAGAEFAGGDGGVDADHGQFDEVGGGALQWRVDSGAFGEATHVGVAGLDVGDGADAAKVGADGAVAAGGGPRCVGEGAGTFLGGH